MLRINKDKALRILILLLILIISYRFYYVIYIEPYIKIKDELKYSLFDVEIGSDCHSSFEQIDGMYVNDSLLNLIYLNHMDTTIGPYSSFVSDFLNYEKFREGLYSKFFRKSFKSYTIFNTLALYTGNNTKIYKVGHDSLHLQCKNNIIEKIKCSASGISEPGVITVSEPMNGIYLNTTTLDQIFKIFGNDFFSFKTNSVIKDGDKYYFLTCFKIDNTKCICFTTRYNTWLKKLPSDFKESAYLQSIELFNLQSIKDFNKEVEINPDFRKIFFSLN